MSFTLLSERTPKARKMYDCDWCGEFIEKGEKYFAYTGVMNGDFQYTKMHLECGDAMNRDIKDSGVGCDYEFEPRRQKKGLTQMEMEE